LTFAETTQPGAFDGADMHEDIPAAVIRLDEGRTAAQPG
jgi:hypothetical protein